MHREGPSATTEVSEVIGRVVAHPRHGASSKHRFSAGRSGKLISLVDTHGYLSKLNRSSGRSCLVVFHYVAMFRNVARASDDAGR